MRTFARALALSLALIAVIAVCTPADAAVIFYTDRPTWLANVGPLSGMEDFSSFVADAEFRTTSVAANNMTISGGTGPNGVQTNKIDVSPFEFSGFFDVDGTPYLLGDLVSPSNPDIRIDFTNGITAWGANFQGIADTSARNTRLDVFDAANVLLGSLTLSSTSQNDMQFYGFELTGGDIADHIIFTNPDIANDTFRIDDIGFVTADAPEPTTLALLGLGVLLLTRRRIS